MLKSCLSPMRCRGHLAPSSRKPDTTWMAYGAPMLAVGTSLVYQHLRPVVERLGSKPAAGVDRADEGQRP